MGSFITNEVLDFNLHSFGNDIRILLFLSKKKKNKRFSNFDSAINVNSWFKCPKLKKKRRKKSSLKWKN